MNATTAALLQVTTAAIVTGVALAWIVYAVGAVETFLMVATWIFGVVITIVALPAVGIYVWHVFYRRPPRPARHRVRRES